MFLKLAANGWRYEKLRISKHFRIRPLLPLIKCYVV
jgi:hypothetical protein